MINRGRARQTPGHAGPGEPTSRDRCDNDPVRAAYARVVEGWLEANVYKGEMVAHRRRNSDAMLRLLLQREDARPIPVGVKVSGGRLVTSGQEAFGEL